jgi:hypothetical protein
MDRLEIFKSIFKQNIDFLDTNSHLNKLFELLPALLGLPAKKKSYNKSKSAKQHEESVKEAQEEQEAMALEFDKNAENDNEEDVEDEIELK